MNGAGPMDHTTREIARGLADVLQNALEPGAPLLAMSAAAEVARLLELPGLERVLVLAEQRTGALRPDALAHVLERVSRLLALVRTHENVMPFVEADGELDALAATIGDQQWAPGEPAGPAVAAIALDDALPGWMLRGLPEESVLVTAPVAAALRASLDWLGADSEQPVDVEIHDDFVALRLDVLQAEGLEGTGDVLGTVGGHLAPERAGSRRWRIVVPRLLQRQAFLLVEQGRLGLALPWHAVLKLRMLTPERAAEEAQVLPALRWGATLQGERPAALIAHGLRRAWLFADRVVWRFAASTEEPDATPPVSGLSRAVRGEDGTLFWVADPAWLLRTTPVVEPEWPIEEIAPADVEPIEAPAQDAPEETSALASVEAIDAGVTNGVAPVEETIEANVPDAPSADPEPIVLDPVVLEPISEPAGEALPPASEWVDDGVEDAPVEWLVTSGSERTAERSAESRPTLSLLRPEDVEPLEASAPVVELVEAPVVVAPEAHVDAPAPGTDAPTLADTASARPSRFMRALTRIAALHAAAAEPPVAEAAAVAEPVVTPEAVEAPVVEVPVADAPAVAEPVVEPTLASVPVEESVAAAPEVAEAPVVESEPMIIEEQVPAEPAAEPVAEAAAVEAPVAEPSPVEPPVAEAPAVPVAAVAPEAPAATPEPAAPEAPVAPAAALPASPAEPLEISSRLALVAEDSLVANIFLQRLLEQRGFRTVSVELGIDLARELGRGGWGLVCVDVQLPDATGPAHLAAAVQAAAAAPTGVAVVALTRDAEDEKLAHEAGVVHSLRKPFEAGSVDRLFAKLGLPTRGGRK